MYIVALFTVSKIGNKCLLTDEWIKWCNMCNGIFFNSLKKEGNFIIFNDKDESG